LGRRGRWEEAATNAALVLKHQPDDHYRYHTLAPLLTITGNRPAYEQLCRRILPIFSNTTNPYVAQRIAADCLLLRDSGVDLQLVDKLVDAAVTLGGGNDLLPHTQVCKALSNYRLGRFAEAIEWAEKPLSGSLDVAKAHAYAVRAMAHWQLGRKEEALAMLAKGDALAPRILARDDGVDIGRGWVAWLFARISLDEATALIQPAAPRKTN
jgi:tetratricopeptide (TPR) repeat protein